MQSPYSATLQSRAPPKIGTVYVQSTKNNTICTLVDTGGMPVAWASAGSCGFKNARKSTPYAAQVEPPLVVGVFPVCCLEISV
jgi:ribosomal protein S11